MELSPYLRDDVISRTLRRIEGTTGEDSDVRTITIRLDDQGEVRLARLLKLARMGQQQVTDVAYAHLLATLEKGQPVYVVPPSELAESESE